MDRSNRLLMWKVAPLLLALGIASAGTAAFFTPAPGTMDAAYYAANGLRAAQGLGETEPFVWNFLTGLTTLPAPAHAYWLPLSSWIAAAGMWVSGGATYAGARTFFVLASAFLPLAAAWAARRWTQRTWLPALAAAFPVFYWIFLPSTDFFSWLMLIGAAFLFVMDPDATGARWARVATGGVLAGLIHLARAEGVLWLALGVFLTVYAERKQRWSVILARAAVFCGGYAVTTGGWFLHNLAQWGALSAPGTSASLWLTRYEDMFLFPAGQLTPERWLAAGWLPALRSRLSAMGHAIGTFVGVQGSVVLWPFILLGGWKRRRDGVVWSAALLWLMLFGLMTVIFPFAGTNGSFYHAGAGLQLIFWGLAPEGIDMAVQAYTRWRGEWRTPPSHLGPFLRGVLAATLVLLTAVISLQRLPESDWLNGLRVPVGIEQQLTRYGAERTDRVLVNNAPAFWLATGREAVVIPFGDADMAAEAARAYGARYLAVDDADAWHMPELTTAGADHPDFKRLGEADGVTIYELR